MAVGEKNTIVRTIIRVTYHLKVNDPSKLMRRERHRIKDESSPDTVLIQDRTRNVGDRDDWVAGLEIQKLELEEEKQAGIDLADEAIQATQDQIDEINAL